MAAQTDVQALGPNGVLQPPSPGHDMDGFRPARNKKESEARPGSHEPSVHADGTGGAQNADRLERPVGSRATPSKEQMCGVPQQSARKAGPPQIKQYSTKEIPVPFLTATTTK